jgi:hypothetical protein
MRSEKPCTARPEHVDKRLFTLLNMKYLHLFFLSFLITSLAHCADVNLSWDDNSTDEDGFVIERAPASDPTAFVEVGRVATDIVTYRDVGLPQGTTFLYRVKAYNQAGNSAYSNVVSATTGTGTNAPPTNVKIIWEKNIP